LKFSVHYVTEYAYASPVTDNLNALRVQPALTPWQLCDDFRVRIEPDTRVVRHRDYFSTDVLEFGIPRPHEHLLIDVRARVATSPQDEPSEEPWEALATSVYEEAGGEFLLPWGRSISDERLDDLVAATRTDSPLETLHAVCALIPDSFAYDPHATYVGSSVSDLLDAGGGVCQDFAHLALHLLRRHGIAARYVSGYLWAAPPDGGVDSVEVHTHAWVEALLPGRDGGDPSWVGADPTNRRLADETHVKIGHGRLYADVPPIKGVYRGSPDATLMARVLMHRLD
jgi:transglutaminase-like putative cysteine protease